MTNENWAVYFHGNFWGHHGAEDAGQAMAVGKQFAWGDEIWHVPAVYLCPSGIVVDLCAQVEPERFRAFLARWNLSFDADLGSVSEEEQDRIRAENPLHLDIAPLLLCDGVPISACRSSCVSWLPDCFAGWDQSEAAKRVLVHYGLDPELAWSIHRICFARERSEPVRQLQLQMVQERVRIPGPRFTANEGETVAFMHPITGNHHELQVHALRREKLEQSRFGDDEREYPNHYVLMDYSVWPPLPPQALSVLDCEPSDELRYKTGSEDKGAVAIGIIGGSDGPTAIILGGAERKTRRAACSALRFAPQEVVHWRMVFHEKLRKDHTVCLLTPG